MQIAIVGTGYVGLVTGTCFAELGFEVTCIDNNKDKIDRLKKGIIPIYESELEVLVKKNISEGRLKFTTSIKEGIGCKAAIFLAVGTPQDKDGSADLSYIFAAAKEIAKDIGNQESILVTKSTVPVGTGAKLKRILKKTKLQVASNPEFLREGSAVYDFMNPDRIVIGTDSIHSKAILEKLYQTFISKGAPIISTDIASAELIKYAANAFLATKIAYINEIADISEKIGANIKDIALGMGLDRRIGKDFLNPGPGYGGSCFPKDTEALLKVSKDLGAKSSIVKTVIKSNKGRKKNLAQKIVYIVGNNKTIAVLGLAFKANTDDARESPAVEIIQQLIKHKMKIKAYDPKAIGNTREILGNKIEYCSNAYDACKGAKAFVVLTEWSEFKNLDFKKIKSLLDKPVIIDYRNILDGALVRKLGFTYYSIGIRS